jgi:hypothetical protein
MKTKKNKTVLVDDDAVFLKSLEIEFLQHWFYSWNICNGWTMFSNLEKKPDVIILDYHFGIDKMRWTELKL